MTATELASNSMTGFSFRNTPDRIRAFLDELYIPKNMARDGTMPNDL